MTFFLALLAAVLPVRGAVAISPFETQSGGQGSQARPPAQLIVNGKVLGSAVPSRPGDICIVCRRPLGTGGVVYLVKGQRIPLHFPSCYEVFVRSPLSFLAALQPHGAFLGSGGEGQGLSWGWFLAGLYILVGLIFGAGCAHRALHAGRSPAAWFAAGLALNVIGYLWLLTRPKLQIEAAGGMPEGLTKFPRTRAPRPCPTCGRMNHPAATQCGDCGAKLQPVTRSEVDKAGLRAG
jgi:hypothetical protein